MSRPIDDIAKAITDAIIDALKDREQELKDIAVAGGEKAGGGILGDVSRLTDIIHSVVGDVISVIEFAFPPLKLLDDVESAGGKLGSGFGIGYLLGYAGWQVMQPFLEPIQHAAADIAQTEIFDPQTAAQLAAKGIISEEFARSEAAGGNMSGEHLNKLIDAAQPRADLAQALDLWNRGEIDEQRVNRALQRAGYPGDWWTPLKALRHVLLSPADLALASLRGNMTTEDAQAYAKRLGVDLVDFDTLIGNTGEPPGPEQLMEALRRGFIDKDRFDRGIRQSRVRNEWIDVEYDLRQSPMTTADAIRATVENYLTEDQSREIAKQNGLIEEHFKPLLESWGRPLSHEQMLTLYYRGEATLDQVRQAMRESDVKDKYIEQAIELGRRLVPERTIVSMLDHGVIDHDRAVSMLHELGYNAEDSDSLIRLGTAQRTASHKTLTRGDILAMYADALLDRKTARDHIMHLGYTEIDANAMLDLADYKRKAQVLKTAQRGIEASLKAHHLTQDQAVTALVKVGVETSQARTLIDEWLQQRSIVTRTLTEAQVLKAVGDKIITDIDGRTRLKAQGLADTDITILFKIHGILPI